ncbi:MAG: hypothetical protein B6I24_07305 [Bacteroidetes bacterium 4572_128]|nr:MAG: hypothetical protein B6I24_07305 [Bacteroidetes bacterium 4572_128]
MKYIFYKIFILILFFTENSNSQNFYSVFDEENKISLDSNKIFFDVKNVNFFKNNEFFNPIVKGYTLIGYFINPYLIFSLSKNIKIKTGVHLLKYSGINNFSKISPIFRFQYNLKSLNIIFGSIYRNHNLIEAIYHFENLFYENIENGLQFLINKNRIKSDIWLNWENFIFHNDTTQEKLSVGISNKFFINNKKNKFQISIPSQLLIFHKGGQINNNENNLQTLINFAVGLNLEFNFKNENLKNIGTNLFFVGFQDNSPSKDLFTDAGKSIYPQIYCNLKSYKFIFSYWSSKNFFSQKGDFFYKNISKQNNYIEKNRELFILQNSYEREIFKRTYLKVSAEIFYDNNNEIIDYSYAFYIIFNFNKEIFMKKH